MAGVEKSFVCYPTKLLAALAQMQPPEQLVYLVVLLRIYESDGACPDTLDAIVRRTGYNKRIVSDALNRLFGANRLRRDADGIRNPVADKLIEASKSLHQTRSVAGKEGANSRWSKTPTKSTDGDAMAIELPMASVQPAQFATSTKEESKKGKKEREPRNKLRTALPDGWQLSEKGRTYAAERGFGHGPTDRMSSKFFNYHRSKGNKMADWEAAWRTWVENEIEYSNRRGHAADRNGSGEGNGSSHRSFAGFAADRARAAGEKGRARAAAPDGAGRPATGEAGSGEDGWLAVGNHPATDDVGTQRP